MRNDLTRLQQNVLTHLKTGQARLFATMFGPCLVFKHPTSGDNGNVHVKTFRALVTKKLIKPGLSGKGGREWILA